jgi:hypothetical protein
MWHRFVAGGAIGGYHAIKGNTKGAMMPYYVVMSSNDLSSFRQKLMT